MSTIGFCYFYLFISLQKIFFHKNYGQLEYETKKYIYIFWPKKGKALTWFRLYVAFQFAF